MTVSRQSRCRRFWGPALFCAVLASCNDRTPNPVTADPPSAERTVEFRATGPPDGSSGRRRAFRSAGIRVRRAIASGRSGERTAGRRTAAQQRRSRPVPGAPSVVSRPAAPARPVAPLRPPAIAADELRSAGIRRIESRHLVMYTDLKSSPEVDELPHVFDLAVPQWCAYFRIDPKQPADWKVTAYVMRRKEVFERTGLLPPELPKFRNGFNRGREIWVYDQPSAYYRRHLVLHEGTHAFMHGKLGGAGPPWYMEGMAELLGTHRWRGGRLQLGYFPRTREEVDHWGRIRIVQQQTAAGRALSLGEVMRYRADVFLQVEPYGWCWAACAMLDGDPRFQPLFRQLPGRTEKQWATFDRRFDRLLKPKAAQIVEQWQWFVRHIDYGFDLRRESIEYAEDRTLPTGGGGMRGRADRGWQSTGIRVASGTRLLVEATGRYQIARESAIWWCEPGGITIRYYEGRPLGMLLAAVTSPSRPGDPTGLLRPEAIGLRRQWTVPRSGVLFFRVNERPSEWADNAGQLTVRIRRLP